MIRVLRKRERQRDEAVMVAKRYVDGLAREVGPVCAILYGSFAKGNFNLGSDIDVMIISDLLPTDPLVRMELLYRYISGGVEPKGYTREEFTSLLQRGNSSVIDALSEGIILADDGFLTGLARLHRN